MTVTDQIHILSPLLRAFRECEVVLPSDEVNYSSEGPSREEAVRELQEVLNSDLFKNSGKLSQLLEYVCNAAVSGHGDQLNELAIGIEVFDRKADFLPSSDSIVRVRAHDLRRRLSEYYISEGKNHHLQIVLPKGRYCPEFVKVRPADARSEEEHSHTSEGPSTQEPSPTIAATGQSGLRSPVLLYVVIAVLVLSLGSNILIWRNLRKAGQAQGSPQPAADLSFYEQLLGPINKANPRVTSINLSNPQVMFKFVSRSPSPASYLGRDPEPIDAELGGRLPLLTDDSGIPYRPGDPIFYFLHSSDDEYTGMGEAACVFHLGRLFQRLSRPTELSQSRFLTWEKTSKQDIIVLGQPLINDWAQKNLSEPNFSYVASRYRNRHPEPGEEEVYRCEVLARSKAEGFVDYGLIVMQRLPNGSRVLTLSGGCSYGTLGTGEFFCDPVKMRPVHEALKKRGVAGAIPAEYEILVKVVIRENIPVNTTFVACRAGRTP